MDNDSLDSSLILYQAEDGSTQIEVRLINETVWLNQLQMCELFDKNKKTIWWIGLLSLIIFLE